MGIDEHSWFREAKRLDLTLMSINVHEFLTTEWADWAEFLVATLKILHNLV